MSTKLPDSPIPNFRLLLSSDEISADDARWQAECQRLLLQVRKNLDSGDLTPERKPAGPGDRSGFIELFNALIATGISIGGFKAIFELTKLWLEHRPTSEVTLDFPDGGQIKVSKVSYREALKLMQQHTKPAGGPK